MPTREPLPADKYAFGFEVMGPILAECCHSLYSHLSKIVVDDRSKVLYCARGGLTIKRALSLYLQSTKLSLPNSGSDFMISRLAAARLSLASSPEMAAPMLMDEFKGRTCGEVASALAGEHVPCDGEWQKPYTHERFSELLSIEKEGRCVRRAIDLQAELLRDHFFSLTAESSSICIVDTGVFGSIGYFLATGLPNVEFHNILLFRANYKKDSQLQFPQATGLVCNEDNYCPWKPRTVSRLYWPFIEAFFEPDLSSVRTYQRSTGEGVISNLQIPNWEQRLSPIPASIRAGAFDYLGRLNADSVPAISKLSTKAWQYLRKQVVYPSLDDLALLGAAERGVDFGFDDVVKFGESAIPKTILGKVSLVRASIWPEGEVRRLFPKTAKIWLRILEVNRTLISVLRVINHKVFSLFKFKNLAKESFNTKNG